MNLNGLMLLKDHGVTIMKDTLFFRSIDEIPLQIIEDYRNKSTMALRGFDDRVKITDSPYGVKSPWVANFSSGELIEKFSELNKRMGDLKIPSENRLFLVCEGWSNEEVEFSGHAFLHDGVIDIDIIKGNKPHQRDWNPNLSLRVPVHNNRPLLSEIDMEEFSDYILDICRTILRFHDKTYLDFTKLKSQRFVYHDLSIHA